MAAAPLPFSAILRFRPAPGHLSGRPFGSAVVRHCRAARRGWGVRSLLCRFRGSVVIPSGVGHASARLHPFPARTVCSDIFRRLYLTLLRPFLSGGASIVRQKIPGSGIRTSLCFRPFSAASCSARSRPFVVRLLSSSPLPLVRLPFLCLPSFPLSRARTVRRTAATAGEALRSGMFRSSPGMRPYRSVSNPARRRMSSALRTVPRSQRSTSSRCSRPASRQPPAPARIRSESR